MSLKIYLSFLDQSKTNIFLFKDLTTLLKILNMNNLILGTVRSFKGRLSSINDNFRDLFVRHFLPFKGLANYRKDPSRLKIWSQAISSHSKQLR